MHNSLVYYVTLPLIEFRRSYFDFYWSWISCNLCGKADYSQLDICKIHMQKQSQDKYHSLIWIAVTSKIQYAISIHNHTLSWC